MGITVTGGVQINDGGIYISKPGFASEVIPLNSVATALRSYWDVAASLGGIKNNNFSSYLLDGDRWSPSPDPTGSGGYVPSADTIYQSNYMFNDYGNYTGPYLLSESTYLTAMAELTGSGSTEDPYIWNPAIPTPNNLFYDVTTASTVDTDFKYVSLGYAGAGETTTKPLTMLGTRLSSGNPSGFQKAGRLGTYPYGTLTAQTIYNGATVSGFTVYAWHRAVYDYEPDSGYEYQTAVDLYILLGHPSWSSSFDTISSATPPVPPNDNATTYQGSYYVAKGASTQNVLAITSLLSCPYNETIPLAELEDIVDNYCTIIDTVV